MTRRATIVAFAAVSAMPSCRCGGNKRNAPEVTEASAESAVLPRVTHPAAKAAPHTAVESTTASGTARRYLLVEPAHLDPGLRYPLVLVLHGDGGDAVGLHHDWPFENASGDDAVVVYPDGIERTWQLEKTTDVVFLERLIDEVASKRPVDKNRVFATGYSSGGFMVNVLACHRPNLLRAFTSSAGGAPFNQPEKWPNGFPKCPGQGPVPMLAMHGDEDGTVTLDSGRFSAEYWAYVNGCAMDQMETTGYPECRVYRGCQNGKTAGLCSVAGLGHWVWSASAEASWTFFQRQ